MSPEQAAAILRIPMSATDAHIRAAYNSLARRSHPDRFAGGSAREQAEASARFVVLGQAHDVLMRHPVATRVAADRSRAAPSADRHPADSYPADSYPAEPVPRAQAPSPAERPANGYRPAAARPPAPPISPRARTFWRWTAIIIAALLALLFSSNSVGLSPGNFGVPPTSPWYLPLMIVAELICLLATVACAVFAATGRLLVAAGVLTAVVVLGFFAAGLLLAPFTVTTLFFAAFGTVLTGSPFTALLLMGRAQRDRAAA